MIKGLEFYKIQFLYDYPDGLSDFVDLPFTVLLMAEFPEFPGRTLDDAQTLLETTHLTPAQLYLCWPKFQIAVMDYAVAWETEDWTAAGEILTKLQSYALITNTSRESIRYFLEDINWEKEYWWTTNPNLVRLTVALARYRRAKGVLPSSLDDLVPDVLSESQAADDGAKWKLRIMPSMEYAYQRASASGRGITLKNNDVLKEPEHVLFYHVQRHRELKLPEAAPSATFPCDGQWDGECAFYLSLGYRQTGTCNVANIAYFAVRVEEWRKVMDKFRH